MTGKQERNSVKGRRVNNSPVVDTSTAESIARPLKRLLHWDELDDWRRDNEFIHTGYVRAENSIRSCLASLGFIHNETGNIYTHLVPSLLIVFLLAFTVVELTQPLTLFAIGCATCLGMSATYHLLTSHSQRVAYIGNKFDYVGICILIASSMVAIIEIAYNDQPRERYSFIAITSVLGLLCSFASLSDTFRTPKYRPVRAAMFVCYGLSGVLPVLVGSIQFGYHEVSRRASCPWLFSEAFMYIFGAFLYAIRFPEKQSPGNFDLIGHSHQIFHIMVVLGAYSHYRALLNAQAYAIERALMLYK